MVLVLTQANQVRLANKIGNNEHLLDGLAVYPADSEYHLRINCFYGIWGATISITITPSYHPLGFKSSEVAQGNNAMGQVSDALKLKAVSITKNIALDEHYLLLPASVGEASVYLVFQIPNSPWHFLSEPIIAVQIYFL